VDHFLRNIQRGLRRDENDAAPIALQHARHVSARQPHARHHIDLEEPAPVAVGNVEEAFGFEDPGIVDENVHLWQIGDQRVASGRRGDIGGNTPDLGSGCGRGNRGDRGIDLALRPAVDHHVGPGGSEAFNDRMVDAGGRSRHQRGLSRKVDFHGHLHHG
jgi:hypothetical protein